MARTVELDYQQTGEMFKVLADIRFKLLALVPTVAGLGTALVGGDGIDPKVQLAVGLVGFAATLFALRAPQQRALQLGDPSGQGHRTGARAAAHSMQSGGQLIRAPTGPSATA
jgi:hypothetical protein